MSDPHGAADTPADTPADPEVDDQEAADLLEVEPGRIDALVEEGALDPVGHDPRRFRRSQVVALRGLGG